MSRLVHAAAVAGVLLFPLTAPAFGGRLRPAGTVAYYYPAPVVSVPTFRVIYADPQPVYLTPPVLVCPPALAAPVAATLAPPLATPTPAPASSPPPAAPLNPPLPPMNKVPEVNESRSYFNAYAVAPNGTDRPTADRAKVGFWNHSGRDLTLKIDGQSRALPQGKGLTLHLPRQFVWQVEARDPQAERISATEAGLEIVIRR